MTAAVIAAGVLVVVALLAWFARRNPGASEVVPGYFAPRRPATSRRRNPELLSWEADLLAASTGGPRGRARLARRLEPVLAAQLRDRHGLALDDEAAVALLGAEWDFLTGGPPPAHARRLDVATAVATVLDRVGSDRRSVTAPSDGGA